MMNLLSSSMSALLSERVSSEGEKKVRKKTWLHKNAYIAKNCERERERVWTSGAEMLVLHYLSESFIPIPLIGLHNNAANAE